MKWEAETVPPDQPEALNCIRDETRVGVRIHEGAECQIGLVGGFGLEEGGKKGSGGVLPLSGDNELEEGVGMGEEVVGAEVVGHGEVGVEVEAEGRVGSGPIEEGEEGEGREGEGVKGDEGGDVGGGERREEGFEGGMEGGLVGVLDGLGEGNEDGELVRSSSDGGDWIAGGGGGGGWVDKEGREEREPDCCWAEAQHPEADCMH